MANKPVAFDPDAPFEVADAPAFNPDAPFEVENNSSPKVVAPASSNQVIDSLSKGARGAIQGAGGLLDLVGGPVNAGINLMGGNLSTSPGHDLARHLADQLGLKVPENQMDELANAINEGGIQGILTAGAGMGLSGAKGITGIVGKALAESPLLDTLSGMTSGASGEEAAQHGAGPMGQLGASLLGGLTPLAMKAAGHSFYKAITDDGMVPESDFVRDLFIDRGTDTTPEHDPRSPTEVTLQAQADEFLANKERLNAENPHPFRVEINPLEKEAAAFKPKAEPTPEDLFPTEEGQAIKSKAMEDKLQSEAETFQKSKVPVEEPVFKEEEPFTVESTPEEGPAKPAEALTEDNEPLPKNVQDIVDHANETMSGWKNEPDVEVLDHFDDMEGVSPYSLGIYNSENGHITLNTKAIESEAAKRGLSVKDMTDTVLFHEGLGHYGLAQKFRDGLDDTLKNFYNNSTHFKKEVDDWIKKSPDSYKNEDTVARAAEEVLAEKSETGRIPVTLMNELTNHVKNTLRKMGVKLEFSNREIEAILAQAHAAVIKGKGVDARGNGYRPMQGTSEEDTKIGNVNTKYISTVNDVDKLLTEMSERNPLESHSWAEAKREARQLNLNPSKVAKGKGLGALDSKITAYRNIQTDSLEKTATIAAKLEDEYNPRLHAQYLKEVAQLALVHARVSGDVRSIAQGLNAMKILTTSSKKAKELLALFEKSGGNMGALADPAAFNKFMAAAKALQNSGNSQGAAILMTKVFKPYWEDYILTGRHAMMLSGFGTHYKNVVENLNIIGRDLAETTVAAPGELPARAYGLLRAAVDGMTWRNTLDAFKGGHGNKAISSKVEIQNARIPGVSKVLDALHAEDVFFRSFIDSSNLYGLGVREAKAQGFKGIKAYEQGSHLALNPTDAMRAEADRLADVALLVSKPSRPVTALETLKARQPNMSAADRTWRAASHIILPFARVSDRLIARRLSRSPLSFMDSATRADWNAGGTRKRIAISRTVLGTVIVGYYIQQAMQGNTTGAEPGYKKKPSLEAGGYMSNAVKGKDKYTDATALAVSANPLNLHNQLAVDVATIANAYKDRNEDINTTAEKIGRIVKGFVATLASGSFADSLDPYLQATKTDDASGVSGSSATANMVAGLASSFIPAALRTLNSSKIDTTRRDTTGDKSFTGRVVGRLKDAVPEVPGITGGSTSLPIKYDVYGRPMERGKNLSGVGNYQKIDKDPTVLELQRLERTEDGPLITKAPTSIGPRDNPVKLIGNDYAEYQRVSGWYFLEGMKKVTPLDAYKNAPDDTKKKAVKEVLAEARSAARDYLYPETEDTDATEGEQ